jgi:phosphoglucomutase
MRIDAPRLVMAYYAQHPEPPVPRQRVQFGTSGHRGSPLDNTFNESHIVSTAQAICDYRRAQKIEGPLPRHRHPRAVDTGVCKRPRSARRERSGSDDRR